MALPTKEKTWQFNVNQTLTGTAVAFSRNLMWAIKEALKGFGTNPWVVVSSSNSATASAGDNWSAPGNLIWQSTSGTHSWIVLQQDGINTGFQFLIDLLSSGDGSSANFYVSWSAGFTGGDPSNRPTASDERDVFGPAKLWGGSNIAPGGSVTVMQSTDGACTRVIILGNNRDRGFWLLDKIKNPVSDMSSEDWVFGMKASNETLNNWMETADWVGVAGALSAYRNSQVTGVMMTLEGQGSDTLNGYYTAPDEVTLEYLLMPPGLFATTAGSKGRIGEIYDLWFGSELFGPAVPIHYPSTGTKLFCQIHDIVLPWDGTSDPLWSF